MNKGLKPFHPQSPVVEHWSIGQQPSAVGLGVLKATLVGAHALLKTREQTNWGT